MENIEGDLYRQSSFLIEILINPVPLRFYLFIFLLLSLILASALVSGSETAFFSLKPKQLNDLDKSNNSRYQAIHNLLLRPRLLLATILISNNFINIAIIILFTMISELLFDFGDSQLLSFIINVGAVTFILVLLGEVIPKIYANQINANFAAFMARPMNFLVKIFYPVSRILVKYSSIIERRIEKKGHDVSLLELRKAIEITSDDQTTMEEKKILRGIVNFGNTTVKQIMTSRVDIVAYDIDTSFNALVKEINEHRYSRLPVFKENIDHIEGVLYIKDLIPFLHQKEEVNWVKLVRKPYFVPDNKMIDDLLKEFQEKKVHLAIVVDEYGGTSGIVTLEDVLEEIVGEINDEFDEEEIFYNKIDDHNYVFDGKTSLTDVTRVMNLEEDAFDKVKGEAESIGGLVVEMSGRIPDLQEQIPLKGFVFTVESVDKKRVRRVKVTESESIKEQEER
ncbi:MAG: gliding motility-associated protein GldE [Bacteroidia bacterium]